MCVNIIKIKKMKRIYCMFGSTKLLFVVNPSWTVSLTRVIINTDIALNIDETEEYLKIRLTVIQVKIKSKASP